jgi:hypothetical protein
MAPGGGKTCRCGNACEGISAEFRVPTKNVTKRHFPLAEGLAAIRKYRLTEADGALETAGGRFGRWFWKGLLERWRQGCRMRQEIGDTALFCVGCSLTLMGMKGYVGGLGASASDCLHIGLLGFAR